MTARRPAPTIIRGSAAVSALARLTGWDNVWTSEHRCYPDGITIAQDRVGPPRSHTFADYVTVWRHNEALDAGYLILLNKDGYAISRGLSLFRHGARTRRTTDPDGLLTFDGKGRPLNDEGRILYM